MKVAILLPGQARFFKNNYDIINLKLQYNASLFIHTWRKNNSEFTAAPYNNIGTFKITTKDLAEYVDFFQPTGIIIEEELQKTYIDSLLKKNIYGLTSHPQTKYNLYYYLYSVKKCFLLSRLYGQYDFFIILRSDMVNIKLPQIQKDKKIIYTPPICDQSLQRNCKHIIVDLMLSIIPGEYTETYVKLIENLDLYYDKGYHYNYEEMFYAHLFETGLLQHCMHTEEVSFKLRRNEAGDLR